MQKSIVCIKLLNFSIMLIPMNMKILSILSIARIAPVILKNVDMVNTQLQVVLDEFVDVELLFSSYAANCYVHFIFLPLLNPSGQLNAFTLIIPLVYQCIPY